MGDAKKRDEIELTPEAADFLRRIAADMMLQLPEDALPEALGELLDIVAFHQELIREG